MGNKVNELEATAEDLRAKVAEYENAKAEAERQAITAQEQLAGVRSIRNHRNELIRGLGGQLSKSAIANHSGLSRAQVTQILAR